MQNDVFRDGQRVVRFNSGFYFARAAKETSEMFERMLAYAGAPGNQGVNDQVVANRVMCKPVGNGREMARAEHGRQGKETVCLWDGRVEVESLPLDEFPNGGAFFGKKKVFELEEGLLKAWCDEGKVKAVHNNWVKGEEEKKERFRKHGFWLWDERRKVCRSDV